MKKKKRLLIKILLIISVALAGIICFYDKCILPVTIEECKVKSEIKAREAVYAGANQALTSYKDGDLISGIFKKTNENTVEIDSTKINFLALSVCQNAQKLLNSAQYTTISLNLGTMSGIVLFASRGPEIQVTVSGASAVCHDYEVIGENVGINNVHYKIILNVISHVNLLLPGMPVKNTVTTKILLVDCIMSGRVPEYVSGTKIYDLSP
ncbi:MAG: sporulation protein YunB [Candidatus Neoclostridium sp.]